MTGNRERERETLSEEIERKTRATESSWCEIQTSKTKINLDRKFHVSCFNYYFQAFVTGMLLNAW